MSERVRGVGCIDRCSPNSAAHRNKVEGYAMQITKRWVCTGAIAAAIVAVPARVGAQNDIDGGRRLFQGMCVECHGAGGAGGDAPSLNRPRLNHAPDDKALASV